MERAVLFFDIDGTILSEYTRTVTESAVTALKAAQAAEPMRSFRRDIPRLRPANTF